MHIEALTIPDVRLITPRRFADERGFFSETFNERTWRDAGFDAHFVQDNHAYSVDKGVVRGLHFQLQPAAQGKLVRVSRGAILDVAVDIRRGSPTYGRWEAVTLDDVSLRQVYLPVGFAHGFVVVSEVADVVYRCSSYYDPQYERGFAWDDPDVAVAWPSGPVEVSARDADAPNLAEIADSLPFVV